MSAPENSKPSLRIPPWLRVKLPCNHTFSDTRALVEGLDLHTVCHSAKCPNMFECFSRKTATFLILGNTCTRNCAFCNIGGGIIHAPDPEEPARVGKAAAALGLRHAVVTSVTRDDLPDGGASFFAAVIHALHRRLPEAGVEVLTPDFNGSGEAIAAVLAAGPTVFNHNIETVERLSNEIRTRATYRKSLEVLRLAAKAGNGIPVKSGIMLGLGETDDEVVETLKDLRLAGVSIVTIGQYLPPSADHWPLDRFVTPDEFARFGKIAEELGFSAVASSPLVRSSYHAGELQRKGEAGS